MSTEQAPMPSFAGVRAKVARALEHLLEVDDVLHKYMDADPIALQRQMQPDGETVAFVLQVTSPPPVELNVLVGDVVHQLRSAVDHIAYALVRASGNEPTRRTAFPVRLTNAQPLVIDGGVTDAALAAVDAVQPYQRKDAAAHPLSVLTELWNIDKHRDLHLTVLQSIGTQIHLQDPFGRLLAAAQAQPGPVGHDGILGVFRFQGGEVDPSVEVVAQGSNFITLGDPGPWPADRPVQLVLEDLHQYVANVMLPLFEPLVESGG